MAPIVPGPEPVMTWISFNMSLSSVTAWGSSSAYITLSHSRGWVFTHSVPWCGNHISQLVPLADHAHCIPWWKIWSNSFVLLNQSSAGVTGNGWGGPRIRVLDAELRRSWSDYAPASHISGWGQNIHMGHNITGLSARSTCRVQKQQDRGGSTEFQGVQHFRVGHNILGQETLGSRRNQDQNEKSSGAEVWEVVVCIPETAKYQPASVVFPELFGNNFCKSPSQLWGENSET